MKQLEQLLIARMVACGALKFGNFTLKSGRISPYFFNSGDLLGSSTNLNTVADALAKQVAGIVKAKKCEYLFGPAYKGITIAAATATALAQQYHIDLPWGYNRKEVKDHGEGGQLAGAPPRGKAVIIDDVLTSGTAVKESIHLLGMHGSTPHTLLLLLDREETGPSGRPAREELHEYYGIEVQSLLRFSHLVEWLGSQPERTDQVELMTRYSQTTFTGQN